MHFPFVSSIALCVPSLCISIHNFIFTCMSTLIFTGGPIESSAAAAAALINLIVIVIAAISSCSSLGDFTLSLCLSLSEQEQKQQKCADMLRNNNVVARIFQRQIQTPPPGTSVHCGSAIL
ncbi:hypothetical protein NC652_032001 [Populus alba x Populus x berolinensis]|nr:hypothetical protein NC652_032001 [Populus alba x Populus x berolinensis]